MPRPQPQPKNEFDQGTCEPKDLASKIAVATTDIGGLLEHLTLALREDVKCIQDVLDSLKGPGSFDLHNACAPSILHKTDASYQHDLSSAQITDAVKINALQPEQQLGVVQLDNTVFSTTEKMEAAAQPAPTEEVPYSKGQSADTCQLDPKMTSASVVATSSASEQASMAQNTQSSVKSGQRPHLFRESSETELQQFIHGPFDLIAGLLITINTFMIFLDLQWQGCKANLSLDLEDRCDWPSAEIVFDVSEHLFSAIFIIELFLRLKVDKLRFFVDPVKPSNFLDAGIVVFSTLDTYALKYLTGSPANMGYLRFLRFTRVIRTIRLVRVLKLVHKLRLLLHTISASIMALLWSMIMLTLLMLMGALLMCQLVQEHISDEQVDIETRLWVNRYYGTAMKSFYTMIEATLSGCWPNYSRKLIEDVSPLYAIPYMFYVAGVIFAIIRIITAIFLKETLQAAQSDAEFMIEERAREAAAYAKKIGELFEEVDTSGDGVISQDEFSTLLENPRMKTYMGVLGLELHESSSLFRLLDDGDGQITYAEFVSGILRLKGQARSQDVLSMMHDNHKIVKECYTLRKLIVLIARENLQSSFAKFELQKMEKQLEKFDLDSRALGTRSLPNAM